MQRDPFLSNALPTPPFAAFRNHLSIGGMLSHKRKIFNSHPIQPSMDPNKSVEFVHQRYNRPRRKQVLDKLNISKVLRSTDHSCGNRRCLVCPLLRHPNFVPSTVKETTHPVDTSLHCRSMGVIYLFTCCRCNKQYVGQTEKNMRQRLAKHKMSLKTAPMTLYSHFLRYIPPHEHT